jgi:hypothetical protein
MTSTCTHTRHQEYDCRIAGMVNKKKFPYDKWCSKCKETFPNFVKDDSEH